MYTLAQILVHGADENPSKTIFSFLEGVAPKVATLTRAELISWASLVARDLHETTRPGGRVVLFAPEGLEFVAGFFGCILSGRVVVPTYPPNTSRITRSTTRLDTLIRDADPDAFLTTPAIANRISALAFELGWHDIPIVTVRAREDAETARIEAEERARADFARAIAAGPRFPGGAPEDDTDCRNSFGEALLAHAALEQERGAPPEARADTIVVILSDHGEEFAEHGQWQHDQVYEECLHVPLMVRLPDDVGAGLRVKTPVALIDVMPTILDVAGADYPKTYKDNVILPNDGISLRPTFGGKPLNRQGPFFVEHENNAFARDGKWKLVGRGVSAASGVVPAKWELYDIEKDRTEIQNLAASHPDKMKDLAVQWNAWAKRAKVYPKNKGASDAIALPDPPQVTGRPFTITAEIEHGNPKGVVLSHGGMMFGYALYFNKGKPAFCMRNKGELTELVAKKKVEGRVTVSASLDDKTITLSVNGKEVARSESPGLFRGQPIIGMYLGEDFKDPVGKYKVPNKFNGKIHSHKASVAAP